ncbi:MAG: hypothetical protein PUP92_17900 [Rhizonema sp. PD38]|nr:hypothetical protein [Rhizonema sp. PD38]
MTTSGDIFMLSSSGGAQRRSLNQNRSYMKKFFPYPGSWLSALLLSVLMTGFVALIKHNDLLLNFTTKWLDKPEVFTIILIIILILPIPALALFHHFFLSRVIPTIPGEKINHQGLFPGLISWWESLYSWLVLILSTLSATLFCTPLLPLFKLDYETIVFAESQFSRNIQVIFAIVWLLSATLFYQIEYLFKLRLIYGVPIISTLESSSDVSRGDAQDDIGLTQIQTEQPAKKKQNIFQVLLKHRSLPKKVFTTILIFLIALWLYLFAKLPEARQPISANILWKNLSPEMISKSPNSLDDTYDLALKKARRAAKLTKSAQSQDEWKIVVDKWQEAIRLMESVPSSNSNYSLAQQKIVLYQIHREFAQKNADGGGLGR